MYTPFGIQVTSGDGFFIKIGMIVKLKAQTAS